MGAVFRLSDGGLLCRQKWCRVGGKAVQPLKIAYPASSCSARGDRMQEEHHESVGGLLLGIIRALGSYSFCHGGDECRGGPLLLRTRTQPQQAADDGSDECGGELLPYSTGVKGLVLRRGQRVPGGTFVTKLVESAAVFMRSISSILC